MHVHFGLARIAKHTHIQIVVLYETLNNDSAFKTSECYQNTEYSQTEHEYEIKKKDIVCRCTVEKKLDRENKKNSLNKSEEEKNTVCDSFP